MVRLGNGDIDRALLRQIGEDGLLRLGDGGLLARDEHVDRAVLALRVLNLGLRLAHDLDALGLFTLGRSS